MCYLFIFIHKSTSVAQSLTIFSNFVHVLLRMVPLCFGRFGRWRCRLDFGSVFYCMSSSSFAVVRRLVLFRVRQNQVTKNLFSNSSAGLATISAQFRNNFFDGAFSFRFRLIVLRVLRFCAFNFFWIDRLACHVKASEFFYMLHFRFCLFFWFSLISNIFVVFENQQRNEKMRFVCALWNFLLFFISYVFLLFFCVRSVTRCV